MESNILREQEDARKRRWEEQEDRRREARQDAAERRDTERPSRPKPPPLSTFWLQTVVDAPQLGDDNDQLKQELSKAALAAVKAVTEPPANMEGARVLCVWHTKLGESSARTRYSLKLGVPEAAYAPLMHTLMQPRHSALLATTMSVDQEYKAQFTLCATSSSGRGPGMPFTLVRLLAPPCVSLSIMGDALKEIAATAGAGLAAIPFVTRVGAEGQICKVITVKPIDDPPNGHPSPAQDQQQGQHKYQLPCTLPAAAADTHNGRFLMLAVPRRNARQGMLAKRETHIHLSSGKVVRVLLQPLRACVQPSARGQATGRNRGWEATAPQTAAATAQGACSTSPDATATPTGTDAQQVAAATAASTPQQAPVSDTAVDAATPTGADVPQAAAALAAPAQQQAPATDTVVAPVTTTVERAETQGREPGTSAATDPCHPQVTNPAAAPATATSSEPTAPTVQQVGAPPASPAQAHAAAPTTAAAPGTSTAATSAQPANGTTPAPALAPVTAAEGRGRTVDTTRTGRRSASFSRARQQQPAPRLLQIAPPTPGTNKRQRELREASAQVDSPSPQQASKLQRQLFTIPSPSIPTSHNSFSPLASEDQAAGPDQEPAAQQPNEPWPSSDTVTIARPAECSLPWPPASGWGSATHRQVGQALKAGLSTHIRKALEGGHVRRLPSTQSPTSLTTQVTDVVYARVSSNRELQTIRAWVNSGRMTSYYKQASYSMQTLLNDVQAAVDRLNMDTSRGGKGARSPKSPHV